MNNPEKAKYLEENLAAIPNCVKSLVNFTKTMPGSPVCTYATYIIGDDGNITCMSGCTNDSDGKIARENVQRKAQEKKSAEEKAARRRKEKNVEEEKAAKRRSERKEQMDQLTEGTFTISATGTDIKSVTQNVIATASGTSSPTGSSFDIRA